jgi:hypothetical protein
MKIFIKFDFNKVCRTVLEEILAKHQISHEIHSFGEIDLFENISNDQLEDI